jgi:hypothetical protein
VGRTASERLEQVMSQYLADKDLQKLPYQERVKELQSRHQETEEIVRNDPILQPARD